ncbi:hypothetical protein CR162_04400 [Pseudoroseomonas rhizosphaerae]|uniref:Methyltransferase FkbM domain-containing protein n=1 Tax=Teichococcus rhizosphaerae TaxID=1335062 RepID=A0A2C7ACF3_9PROT|nr:FkbM family methyltransferase [Pseudoroseomonas rhizosphaerae]PHK96090.1 hypothetical protein CR162_04400 [Pseudoroseomonas rhizosphaerae]
MDELTFLTRWHRPGLIVDAGAHDGLLTLPLARLPGARVLAFEPLPEAHARLARACAGLANVTLRREALSDAAGTLKLVLPVLDGVPQEQWASTVKSYAGFGQRVGTRRLSVPAVTLDSLALADVVALKLDVEGAEYEVLRGARETLRRCRPLLTLELEERHREGATWAVPAFLDALGYDTGFHLDGRWHPVAALDRPRMHRASPDPSVFGAASERYVFNFFAWPRERDAEVRGV